MLLEDPDLGSFSPQNPFIVHDFLVTATAPNIKSIMFQPFSHRYTPILTPLRVKGSVLLLDIIDDYDLRPMLLSASRDRLILHNCMHFFICGNQPIRGQIARISVNY